jgi:hypothetical protein
MSLSDRKYQPQKMPIGSAHAAKTQRISVRPRFGDRLYAVPRRRP